MENYIVYRHVNKINNKQYIGITKNGLERRSGINGKGYGTKSYFACAIKHFGWDSFTHEILYSGLSKEEACQKEIELIAKFRTNEHDFGYNSTSGGEMFTMTANARKNMSKSAMGNKNGLGKPCSKEKAKKISDAQKGRKFTEEHKKKLSLAKQGSTHKSLDAIGRQHISNSTYHNSIKKPVYCIENNTVYESVQQCARELNLCATNLVKCLKGKIKSTKGLHFIYHNK